LTVKEKKKFSGGYLSLKEVIYLMLCAITAVIFIPAIKVYIIIKITIFLMFAVFFLLCAFLKISEQNFDKFIIFIAKYLFRRKKFLYKGESQWF